jgi:hypothetical protein
VIDGACSSSTAELRATSICEAFTGLALIEATYGAVVTQARWKRLPHSPVKRIVVPGDRLSDVLIDIDASGDGWVRLVSGDPCSVTYEAGLATRLRALPEPLRVGITRLAELLANDSSAEPPAAVAALWRPWRRVRLGDPETPQPPIGILGHLIAQANGDGADLMTLAAIVEESCRLGTQRASAIEARSDETLKAAQPEGQERDPQGDAQPGTQS